MQNKVKYIILFLLILFIGAGLLSLFLYSYSNNLEQEIVKRDLLLKDVKQRDSLYESKTKKYAEVITKYVSDCNFYVDGKKISTSELLRITNKTLNENRYLKDSLHFYIDLYNLENEKRRKMQSSSFIDKDSLAICKQIIEMVKSDYGISYTVGSNTNTHYFVRNRSKADSALILFPHFKDKLSFDSTKNAWLIVVDKVIRTAQNPKKNKLK